MPNATTGVNTVLHNIVWNPDAKDEILQLNIIYGACGNTTEYICESTAINYDQGIVNTREIKLIFPLSDADIIAAFKSAIQESRAAGRRPRVAIFDTIVSIPGVRLPFESLTKLCRSENVLSLIDGAHGIGQVKLDLSALDPDFFVSNCHKWLFVPRSCAVFYVPERNQAMIRTTLPTSHGFVPKSAQAQTTGAEGKSAFVLNFEFIGTLDSTQYACVPDAIKWRQEVCGGEERIESYCKDLARKGGQRVADILGTEVLDNKEHTISDCCMVNIRLPLAVGEGEVVKPGSEAKVLLWMLKTAVDEYKTYLQLFPFQGGLWIRISAQIYLEIDDFEWAGKTLKELCGKVEKGEFLNEGK
jgi:selenocysteine lyase/cysteine desulfurase